MELPIEFKKELYQNCYLTNNNFAYKYDTKDNPDSELKITNFVPTYDPWCLACHNKSASKRCSVCHSVYFCNSECQKKCWKIHKKHCNRNLFCICIACGNKNTKFKCDKCPVQFCSDKCKNQIYKQHKDFDCDYFSKTFNNQ